MSTPNDKSADDCRKTDSSKICWDRAVQCCSGIIRLLILAAMFAGAGATLSTFRELAAAIQSPQTASIKQQIIAAPSGEVSTSTSGIIKLLLGPSTNSASAFQQAEVAPADALLLPVERTERRPVVVPYIASLAACVIVLSAFIWGIVRVWSDH